MIITLAGRDIGILLRATARAKSCPRAVLDAFWRTRIARFIVAARADKTRFAALLRIIPLGSVSLGALGGVRMSEVSDPRLRAATPLDEAFSRLGNSAHAPALAPSRWGGATPVARPMRARVAAYAMLSIASTLLALRFVASLVATPLDAIGAIPAPRWMVEVTTTGETPTTALVYGREVGVQLVEIPAASGTSAEHRIVPARLARGQVHFLSLGLTSLEIRAKAPGSAPRMSFAATGRVITAYQQDETIGVRTGW